MTEIVKLQVALNRPRDGRALVYDRFRRHVAEQPVPQAALDALGGASKGYFRAHWSGGHPPFEVGISLAGGGPFDVLGGGGWVVGERVDDQPW